MAFQVQALRRWEHSFVGRCLGRFLELQGLDRALTISAQAFTALIPLFLVVAAVSPADRRISDAITDKFDLTGSAAEAVDQLFARHTDSAIGAAGFVLLFLSGVSLTRRIQKLYLEAWQLDRRLGIRSSLDASLGLAALLVEVALLSLVRALVQKLPLDWVLGAPVALLGSLVLWTSVPWLLLDRRISWRRLLPLGALTALSASVYGLATSIYMPRVIESNSQNYGLFGVTLALVGWLLCISFILVGATVVATEFDRAPERWARRLRVLLGLEQDGRDDVPEEAPGAPAAKE